jgi:hypothetical protein
MNHWLHKKEQREINQSYIDYANDYFNHMGAISRKSYVEYFPYAKSEIDIWRFITSGYRLSSQLTK